MNLDSWQFVIVVFVVVAVYLAARNFALDRLIQAIIRFIERMWEYLGADFKRPEQRDKALLEKVSLVYSVLVLGSFAWAYIVHTQRALFTFVVFIVLMTIILPLAITWLEKRKDHKNKR